MLARLKSHLEKTQLIPPGISVLVGYSGGADSTALLHLLHSLKFDCVAAHLHHGMRPEGDDELQKCSEFAEALGIPFISGRADVPGLSEKLKVGIEEAGRHARLNFFRQSAYQTNCQLIATGHTQDDHVETILMHMIRGSGPAGLIGIHSSRDSIIRPLLPFTRAETRAYCEANNLWFHDDPGNFNENFTRVRLRHRLIPEFETINPNFRTAITRLAETTESEDQFLNHLAANLLQQSEIPLNGNLQFLTQDVEACFSTTSLANSPEVLIRRAIRLATSFIGGELDYEQTLHIVNLIQHQTQGSITTEKTPIVIEISANEVHIRSLAQEEPFRFPLTIPGETESEIFGWKFTAQSTSPSDYHRDPNSLNVVFDQAKTQGGLHFRAAQPGDQIIPFGESSPRKVTDLLSSAKLTSTARRRLPIICDMIGPIWIPGVRLNERVRISPDTNKALRVQFESL
ncbi:MAG: tRNA lysidine(34) synthetase TilS [Fimbriimonadaceae bacterium]